MEGSGYARAEGKPRSSSANSLLAALRRFGRTHGLSLKSSQAFQEALTSVFALRDSVLRCCPPRGRREGDIAARAVKVERALSLQRDLELHLGIGHRRLLATMVADAHAKGAIPDHAVQDIKNIVAGANSARHRSFAKDAQVGLKVVGSKGAPEDDEDFLSCVDTSSVCEGDRAAGGGPPRADLSHQQGPPTFALDEGDDAAQDAQDDYLGMSVALGCEAYYEACLNDDSSQASDDSDIRGHDTVEMDYDRELWRPGWSAGECGLEDEAFDSTVFAAAEVQAFAVSDHGWPALITEKGLKDLVDTLGRSIGIISKVVSKSTAAFEQMDTSNIQSMMQGIGAVLDAAGFPART